MLIVLQMNPRDLYFWAAFSVKSAGALLFTLVNMICG
ncbi:MAG: hypothetical protein Hyperionvirus9_60 [Hyperionvirus sp.]|uniref:Uncharacterized protein n=1 Tax=Hyperionvirus sp. TaxID=2487770 RepID=A0A3G5ACM9_9VIRU|nr:MAG: hypothetical protein Hyperionvirus9_60 [Hyperionvirus sp.]